ncbi:MAG: indole-3-glycerol phosphate synthase TrpC [Mariniblastus sp.]|nr:indole-3-glycerol phosphate synthase TrpC [Mariniblastus sp.]
MASILDKIVAQKRIEIDALRQATRLSRMIELAEAGPPVRDFAGAIRRDPGISLIAEIKRASPSKGLIREDFDLLGIARQYQENGASCISVLTDEEFFQGQLDYLKRVRERTEIPLLRKDFILDPIQVYQARAFGADALLLIAECLVGAELQELHDLTVKLGMTPLVELYDPANVRRVVDCGAELIGVNNRDLKTFDVDLEHTIRVKQALPADRMIVGESGIFSAADARQLAGAGVDAMLVGESLMRADDIGQAVRNLLA